MSRIGTTVPRFTLVITWLGIFINLADAQVSDGHGHSDPKKTPNQVSLPKCPVMDEPVDFSVKEKTREGPVYFCCKDCIEKLKANPKKYEKQVTEQRTALADLPKIQVACPVSSEPIDDKVFVEEKGNKTYFCCDGCLKKYRKEPAKYAAALAVSFTYQTRCPVMGEEIDPTAFIKLKSGQSVFFCCDGCDKKFLKDPGKYATNLESQGTYLDVKKIEVESRSPTGHDDKKKTAASTDGDHAGHDHQH
jgi:YHS domain-containing protein